MLLCVFFLFFFYRRNELSREVEALLSQLRDSQRYGLIQCIHCDRVLKLEVKIIKI